MMLAVVGANGRTGVEVVSQAMDRGHNVRALVRRPDSVAAADRLTVGHIDVLDATSVAAALAGCDAVLSVIGAGTTRAPTTVYSDGVRNLLAGAAAHGIRRLSVVSAAPAGSPGDQPPVVRLLIAPVLERLFGASYADMRRMEAILADSDLDWVCLRPGRLLRRRAAGYRVDARRLPSSSVSHADLAAALLDSLEQPTWRQIPQYLGR